MTGNEAGFALLEVLVAFTIAAIALAFAFTAIQQSAAAARLSEERVVATSHAEAAMASAVSDESGKEGRFSDKFSWRVERRPVPSSTGDEDHPMVRLEVTVEWFSASRKQTLTLSTLRFQRSNR